MTSYFWKKFKQSLYFLNAKFGWDILKCNKIKEHHFNKYASIVVEIVVIGIVVVYIVVVIVVGIVVVRILLLTAWWW